MNILTRFFNRSGKLALSALQAVGLTAVVGVAGVAAYQYLAAPADDTTAFNPAATYNSNVEYVSVGTNAGNYQGTAYGGGAVGNSSSVRVSSATLQRMNRLEQAAAAREEMEEMSGEMSAYQMSGSTDEGLGMGGNAANDELLKNNPMAQMQGSMAGVQEMLANAQKQAQGAAAAQGQAAQSALASAKSNWSKTAGANGSTRAGGAEGGSSYVLQNSGKNVKAGSMDAASLQAKAAGMLEGRRLRGNAPSFGPADKDATVMDARMGTQGKDDMDFFAKRSIDTAKNKNRHNTEANVFLAGTQISGGLMINSENVTTGEGQASADFGPALESNLRGIQNWGAGIDNKARRKAGGKLFGELLWRFLVATALIPVMLGLMFQPGLLLGKLLRAALAGFIQWYINQLCFGMFNKVAEFREQFGATGWDTTAEVLVGIIMALSAVTWSASLLVPSNLFANGVSIGFAQHMGDIINTFGIRFSKNSDAAEFAKQRGTQQMKDLVKEFNKIKEAHTESN